MKSEEEEERRKGKRPTRKRRRAATAAGAGCRRRAGGKVEDGQVQVWWERGVGAGASVHSGEGHRLDEDDLQCIGDPFSGQQVQQELARVCVCVPGACSGDPGARYLARSGGRSGRDRYRSTTISGPHLNLDVG
jgi:hypothetical protein